MGKQEEDEKVDDEKVDEQHYNEPGNFRIQEERQITIYALQVELEGKNENQLSERHRKRNFFRKPVRTAQDGSYHLEIEEKHFHDSRKSFPLVQKMREDDYKRAYNKNQLQIEFLFDGQEHEREEQSYLRDSEEHQF